MDAISLYYHVKLSLYHNAYEQLNSLNRTENETVLLFQYLKQVYLKSSCFILKLNEYYRTSMQNFIEVRAF